MTLREFYTKAGIILSLLMLTACTASKAELKDKEEWQVDPQFEQLRPMTIGVLPMENLSLEPGVEDALFDEVYQRLSTKGYAKVSVDRVRAVMKELGVQTPGQLAGISLERLGKQLNCEAVLRGRIDQSADIHSGVYDAVVVSCSLRLIHCTTGKVLWETEQWRTAHRQWQADPFNMLLNLFAHKGASREKRIAFLVYEMLKTLPEGPVNVIEGDSLLEKATQIPHEKKE